MSRYQSPGRTALEDYRRARASGPLVHGGCGRDAAEVRTGASSFLVAVAGAIAGLAACLIAEALR